MSGSAGRHCNGYHGAMPAADLADVLDSDLPLVRRHFPWPLRLLFFAFGLFAMAMPAWELGRGLWPVGIATPVFAVIIMGAAVVGLQFVRIGLSGGGEAWRYPPRAIVVSRRTWGREASTRLSATNVAAVDVRHLDDADDDGLAWQVVVVPKPTFSGMSAAAGPGGVFDAGRYGSEHYAERVRRALQAHLGL